MHSMKRVLCLGGAGFIGSYVVRELLSAGYHVTVVDNFSKYGFLKHDFYDHSHFSLQSKDVRAMYPVEFAGYDIVLCLAALIGGIKYFHRIPYRIARDNTQILAHAIDATLSAAPEATFVYFSSSMVYERMTRPVTEEDALQQPVPITNYGMQKLFGEFMTRGAHLSLASNTSSFGLSMPSAAESCRTYNAMEVLILEWPMSFPILSTNRCLNRTRSKYSAMATRCALLHMHPILPWRCAPFLTKISAMTISTFAETAPRPYWRSRIKSGSTSIRMRPSQTLSLCPFLRPTFAFAWAFRRSFAAATGWEPQYDIDDIIADTYSFVSSALGESERLAE